MSKSGIKVVVQKVESGKIIFLVQMLSKFQSFKSRILSLLGKVLLNQKILVQLLKKNASNLSKMLRKVSILMMSKRSW